MTTRSLALGVLLSVLCGPAFAADEVQPPAKEEVVRVGSELPFMVADFVNGKHHCGCPSAMIGNHDARALVIWTRTADTATLDLIKQIDPLVNGGNRQAYLITLDEEPEALKIKAEPLGLKSALAGASRRGSKQVFTAFGVEPATQYAIMLVDDKAIHTLWKLPPGGLTKEQTQTLVRDATTYLKK